MLNRKSKLHDRRLGVLEEYPEEQHPHKLILPPQRLLKAQVMGLMSPLTFLKLPLKLAALEVLGVAPEDREQVMSQGSKD